MIRTAFTIALAVLFGSTAGAAADNDEPRTPAFQFVVSAGDTHDLGSWSKVTGLDVTWDIAEYRSGDQANVSRPFFPTANTKYTTVKLSRASSSDLGLVLVWLRDLEATGERPALMITLIDQDGTPVVRWLLERIDVRNYVIGGEASEGSDVAIETLVVTHEGFSVVPLTE